MISSIDYRLKFNLHTLLKHHNQDKKMLTETGHKDGNIQEAKGKDGQTNRADGGRTRMVKIMDQ